MKKLFLILLGCFISNLLEAQSWNEFEIGTNDNLNKVYFINNDTGFIIGSNGLLLKTIDGGETWETIITNVQHNLNTISFANEEVGYINGLKTTDGASTWIPQTSSEIYGFIYAYNENRIMAEHGDSFNGQIYESNDGGESWEITYTFGELTMFNDCDFISQDEGYLSSWYAGHLFKTVDAGANWSEIEIDEVDGDTWVSDDYRSVAFPSPEIGLVTHQSGILKTLNAGDTWSEIKPEELSFSFYSESVIAPSIDNYILVGKGNTPGEELQKIYETFDGGDTWIESANTVENMSDVACSSIYCFAVGSNGTVYRRENLTNSISENLNNTVISIFPNPAKDILSIAYKKDFAEVRIYNLNGKLLNSFSNRYEPIKVSQLNSGIYIVEVICKDEGI